MKPNSIGAKILIASLIIFVLIAGLIYYAFAYMGSSNDSPNPNFGNSPTPTITVQQSETPTSTITSLNTPTPSILGTTIVQNSAKIYFSKNPESNNNFTYVVPVSRTTKRIDLARFSIEQLIIGPSGDEKAQGLFTPLILTGASICSGADFTLELGTDGTTTVKFCKQVTSNGIGDDARVKSTLEATLKQFTTIKKVIILDKNENCFGDQSGLNQCKQ